LAPDVGIVDAATMAVKSRFWAAEPNLVAASIDSERVATVGDDDVIRVWDLEGRQLAAVGGQQQQVWKLHFCREGTRLFAAVGDDVIAFGVENLEVLWRSTEHQNTVNSLAVSHGNDLVASTSQDLTAKLWSVETGELMHNLTGHTAGINSVAFSLDDRLVATGDYSGVVKIWDVQTGQELLELREFTHRETISRIRALAFQSATELTVWCAFYEGKWQVGPAAR
jgi:WD40 repeat protein